MVLRLKYGLAADRQIFDVPRRRCIENQRIVEVARQPSLKSDYNPSEKHSKTTNDTKRNLAADKYT